MKVVLFCGGMGLRMRERSEDTPKPLTIIGHRPILWHLMKYYGYYGHKDFILCLGYGADAIKKYFMQCDEYVSNEFLISNAPESIMLGPSGTEGWTVTLVNTGLASSIGQRLRAVKQYMRDEDVFLANYADGLTDLPLDDYIKRFESRDRVASVLCVRPRINYHVVSCGPCDLIESVVNMQNTGLRINGGYFIFKNEIFDYLMDGEDLVQDAFPHLIQRRQLLGFQYDGFWACMDTFKDKQQLNDLWLEDCAPWQVWRRPCEYGLVDK